jgi:hypothetical protein
MDSLRDLEIQNLQDALSILYLYLADAVLQSPIDDSEAKIRAWVRAYGKKIGQYERTCHLIKGRKINLETFYHHPEARIYDPRFYAEEQRLNEQVALFHVIRCPFALTARRAGKAKTAKIFCEEYSSACLEAYTENVAQVNVSEVLTEPRDSHCRLATYFRPANTEAEKVRDCFTENREISHETDSITQDRATAQTAAHIEARIMLDTFYEMRFPENVTKNALQEAAKAVAFFLKERSVSMFKKYDEQFLKENCPVSEDVTQPKSHLNIFREFMKKAADNF